MKKLEIATSGIMQKLYHWHNPIRFSFTENDKRKHSRVTQFLFMRDGAFLVAEDLISHLSWNRIETFWN